ncbi:MAG: hypothetical protein LBK08_08010 [Treponema sp.]|nr:hypothetical protein [Treponema sp.]
MQIDRKSGWPFSGYQKLNGWQEFSADGFNQRVHGCVYAGSSLRSSFPLGGIGTGYLGLLPDGRIGEVSIYNEFVPPLSWNKDWLSIRDGNVRESLSAADLHVWGHYPVYDAGAAFGRIPVEAGIRAFTPFVPGDAKASCTPAAAFEIRLFNTAEVKKEFEIALRFPPAVRKLCSCAIALNLPGTIARDNAGASCVVAAGPGETVSLRAVFSWYAPHWRDKGNEAHVNFYATLYKSAAETAQLVLDNFDLWLRRSQNWQGIIYAEDYPPWLKDALVQNMYSIAKNTVWIAKTRKDEWWSGDCGWFTHNESHRGCPITETMVCRMHGHFPFLFFFPELEETALRAFRHFQAEDGEICFSFGLETSMRDVRYHCQHPLDAGYYVQQILRWYQRTGNKEKLKEYYESLKRAVRYHYTLDDDGDGLVNDQPHVLPGEIWPANQFYDIWPWWGTSVYVAGVWLATLKAAAATANLMEDGEFAAECDGAFAKGIKAFDEKLWRGDYYRLWTNPEGKENCEVSLGNQLMTEWCAAITGTGPVVDEKKTGLVLDAVLRLNAGATAFGMVNGVTPNGERFYSVQFERSRDKGGGVLESRIQLDEANDHSAQIFIGESFAAVTTFLYKGRREQGLEIGKRLYEMIALHTCTPWDQYCLYDSCSGQPIWGHDYYSNMIQWLLPVALEGKNLAQYFSDQNNLVNRIIAAGKKQR